MVIIQTLLVLLNLLFRRKSLIEEVLGKLLSVSQLIPSHYVVRDGYVIAGVDQGIRGAICRQVLQIGAVLQSSWLAPKPCMSSQAL